MTIEELKSAIIAIDTKLDSDDINDEEFTALEEEARAITAKLGEMESAADFRRNAKTLAHVSTWYADFLMSFGNGTRKVTNKQAECFKRLNSGKPFIWNGRRYDCPGANYRAGFSTLIVTPLN